MESGAIGGLLWQPASTGESYSPSVGIGGLRRRLDPHYDKVNSCEGAVRLLGCVAMSAALPSDHFYLGFGPTIPLTADRRLNLPVLAGMAQETLFGHLESAGINEGFELFVSPDWLVGVRVEPLTGQLGAQTAAIYAGLLAVCRAQGRELVRIWNYVPAINEQSVEGMEVYRVFCQGRANAFDQAGWNGPLPAASAVGGASGVIAVMFAAARERPQARENPEQVPAFEYPYIYGPRSPSFSRAMQVMADGRRWTFISGTAAIKGHQTVAEGDLAGQVTCTLDNLRLIALACGLGESLGADRAAERHFKIYLRTASELPAVAAILERGLLRDADQVTWLHADICRADLAIEIEATVIE